MDCPSLLATASSALSTIGSQVRRREIIVMPPSTLEHGYFTERPEAREACALGTDRKLTPLCSAALTRSRRSCCTAPPHAAARAGLTHESSRRTVYGAAMFIYNDEYDAIFFACHGSFASMAGVPAVMDAVRLCLGVTSQVPPLCCVLNEHDILDETLASQAQHFGGGRPHKAKEETNLSHGDIGFSFSMAFRCATGALSLIDGPSPNPAVDQLLVRALAVQTCARAQV
jgi:hypothetical protein